MSDVPQGTAADLLPMHLTIPTEPRFRDIALALAGKLVEVMGCGGQAATLGSALDRAVREVVGPGSPHAPNVEFEFHGSHGRVEIRVRCDDRGAEVVWPPDAA